MLGYHEFLFFHSSFIYVLIWQIFSSYYEYSTMLYSGEAYELRIIYWECKDTLYTFLVHRKPSAKLIDHSTTMPYEVKMCLKYLRCSLYSSNIEKLLYSGHQVLAELRVLGKTDMSKDNCHAAWWMPRECCLQSALGWSKVLHQNLGTLILTGRVHKSPGFFVLPPGCPYPMFPCISACANSYDVMSTPPRL